jgi:hypothetical protein
LALRNANSIRGTPVGICDGITTYPETPMSEKAPKANQMLPIDNDDHTMEVDTRWMLMENPQLRALMESDDTAIELEEDESTDYEDPRLADALTATQVLALLNVGK